MAENSGDNSENITQFTSITGLPAERAQHYLNLANNDIVVCILIVLGRGTIFYVDIKILRLCFMIRQKKVLNFLLFWFILFLV